MTATHQFSRLARTLFLSLLGVAWFVALVGLPILATTQGAQAQTSCPDRSVISHQTGRYAYNLIERNLGGTPTCTGQVGIPRDGIRAFSSWRDCRSGVFSFARESGGGAVPTSFSCPNCAGTTAREAVLAPGTSSSVTALFNFPDGQRARYTATISRSVADVNGRFTCSITNVQVAGGAFGGDIDPPTVTLGTLNAVGDGTYSVTITLSEPAGAGSAFDDDDLSLTNATASLSGSGTSFTATLTPSADGSFGLAVPAEAFHDAAGNHNTAAAQVSATHDGTRPTVQISGLPTSVTGPSTLSATITFSEPVTGFELGDIQVSGGTATALSGSGASYLVALSTAGTADLVVEVPADIAEDASGNRNRASSAHSSRDLTAQETQAQIATFMGTRANNLASNQPKLTCFVLGGCAGGSFQAQVTRGQLSFDFASARRGPFWATVTGARTTDGDVKDEYVLATFGTHWSAGQNTVLGAMVELDYQSSETGQSSIKGTGWLVGPYFVTKLPDQPLVFEGRALWGKTQNTISPFGTYEDDFETERFLIQTRLSGQVFVEGLTLIPFASASITSDHQKAYEDSLGNKIASQTVTLRQASLGLDASRALDLNGQTWVLDGGASVFWSETTGDATQYNFEGSRGRVHLGLSKTLKGGQFAVSSFYDGIGTSGFESYGLDISFGLTF